MGVTVGSLAGFTADSVANDILRNSTNNEGENVWQNAYDMINTANRQSIGTAYKDYSQEIADAYSSYMQNKGYVNSLNIGENAKTSINNSSLDTLKDAYKSYLSTYQQNANTINESTLEATEELTSNLYQQGKYTADTLNLIYPYLQTLYEKGAISTVDENGIIKANEGYERYFDYDESKNVIGLKNQDDFYEMLHNTDTTDNGLSYVGEEIFDQLFNKEIYWTQDDVENKYKFTDYLSELDKKEYGDLVEWLNSGNSYFSKDINTNFGMVKALTGSEDDTYSFLERFGALTESEIDDMYLSLDTAELQEALVSGNSKDIEKASTTFVENLNNTIHKFGLDSQYAEELSKAGITADEFNSYLKDTLTNAQKGESAKKEKWTAIIEAGSLSLLAVIAGAASVISFGTLTPLTAEVIGAATIGAIDRTIAAGSASDYQKQYNEESINSGANASKAITQYLVQLAALTKDIQKHKQYSNNK